MERRPDHCERARGTFPTRRAAMGLVAAGAVSLAAAPVRSMPEASGTGLVDAARKAEIVFGVAADSEVLADPAYRALILANCELLTPSNSLKFAALQPEEGVFRFEKADALVDFAARSGFLARGHTLVWNDYPPPWLANKSGAELARLFDAYLDRVVPHYAGRLQSWDVVNEPFWLGRDRPGTFRPGPWLTAFGEDYVERAFKRTAALDPSATLVLNEAWTECDSPVGRAVRASLLALIDRLQHAGVKLGAVGLQGHILPGEPWDGGRYAEFLHGLAERKLDIYITELDVVDDPLRGDVAQRDTEVAELTRRLLAVALKVPAVKMLIAWSLSDKYSWLRNPWFTRRKRLSHVARPCPFDDEMRRKPMAATIAETFRATRG